MDNSDLSSLRIDKSGSVYRPRRRRRHIFWISALLSVAVIFIFLKYFFNPPVEVEVATVSQTYPSQALTILNASGYVVAQRKAAVASKATGRLEWLGVEEGSKVKSGQIIARLEGRDAAAARDQAAANLGSARFVLEEAKAELEVAGLNYARNKELLEKGFIAATEYDASAARYKKAGASVSGAEASVGAASAALQAAEAAVEYTLIRSPFDAVVLTKNADIGDIVTPIGAAANAKAAVVTIADLSSLRVEADVSESNLERVKAGQPCEIQLDAFPEARFRGVVHMIVPTADRSKASVMIKVRFLDTDNRILPEMSAKVAFLERPVSREEQRPRTAINPSAVVAGNGKKKVFLVRGDQAEEAAVTTGSQLGELLEVISGVKTGDKVVISPPRKLRHGSKIRIAENAN